MRFILTGFSHQQGSREFVFERIVDRHTRTVFTVKADLHLVGRYGIRLQELPLLCLGLLERLDEGAEKRSLTFTEEEMRVCADQRTAARELAAQKRKPGRRPPSENTGNAWRAPS